MEKKSRNSRKKLQHGINIGAMVAQHIEQDPNLSYQIVADKMGIGKSALAAKVKLPYFGTAESIASVSKICGVNFFMPYLEWLKKEGVPSNDEYTSMQMLLNHVLAENEDLKETLKQLKLLNKKLIES